MWKQHKEVFVLKSINNVVIILSVRCKECGNTSDLRAKDLCLQVMSFCVEVYDCPYVRTNVRLIYINP